MGALPGDDSCLTHSTKPATVARRAAGCLLGGKHGGGAQGKNKDLAKLKRRRRAGLALSLSDLTAAEFVKVVELVRRECQRRMKAGELAGHDLGVAVAAFTDSNSE